jgi:molybdopterin-synthase adenylyltransferase
VKYSVIIKGFDWEKWQRHFSECESERMVFGYCGANRTYDEIQFLVQEVDLPGDEEYRHQAIAGVSLKAECVVPRIARAKAYAALVDGHSHPFTKCPWPSGTDNFGAQAQFRVLSDLAPNTALIRMIFGRGDGLWVEVTRPGELCWAPVSKVVVLAGGGLREILPINAPLSAEKPDCGEQDVRTASVLGRKATDRVRALKVLVIGAGGVGSAVIAQLRGYINALFIVAPDKVSMHGAMRLYHYAAGDEEGISKVEMHAREIGRSFPGVRVNPICERFPEGESIEAFKRADVVFCCPDHNAVRYRAAQMAQRFLKPLIEVGCGGRACEGRIVALGYHVRLQVPGDICLACNGLDISELEDPSSSEMKQRAGYVAGGDLVQGELMTLTTRAAADAVDFFFRYFTGYADPVPTHLYYDALRFVSVNASDAFRPHPLCTLCGENSARVVGAGDTLPEDQQVMAPPGGNGTCR